MAAIVLGIAAPRKPSEIPPNDVIISAAKSLLEDSLSWKLGKVYHNGLVQTAHAVLPDGSSYIHEIKKVTLVKTLSPTASIWTILYGFPPPMSPRVFTILQITHLDSSTPRTGWVVHLPIDLTGPGDEALRAHEDRGIKGRYACVERITELPDGRGTEWRLVTSSTPAGLIPKALAEKTLPARISLVSSYS
ncbi:hypothetical protein B0H11DRAFT_2161301 [Mycena galericulata]|nr:hypothetical protein B0H11DRAFT_2161301 [Mycena galericulata]